MIYNIYFVLGIITGLLAIGIFTTKLFIDLYKFHNMHAAMIDILIVLTGMLVIAVAHVFCGLITLNGDGILIVKAFFALFYTFLGTVTVFGIYDLIRDLKNIKK